METWRTRAGDRRRSLQSADGRRRFDGVIIVVIRGGRYPGIARTRRPLSDARIGAMMTEVHSYSLPFTGERLSTTPANLSRGTQSGKQCQQQDCQRDHCPICRHVNRLT
jgi:hypothetical protein